MLRQLFGFELILLGGDSLKTVQISSIANKHHVITKVSGAGEVIADFSELPFLPNSVDVMVLHHGLEQVKNPKLVLQELYRMLRYDGYLILLGYNPWRWQARKFWQAEQKRLQHPGQMQSLVSLRYLLEALGFSIRSESHYGFWQANSLWLECWGSKLIPLLSTGYGLLLQKSEPGVSAVRPAWLSFGNLKKTTVRGLVN